MTSKHTVIYLLALAFAFGLFFLLLSVQPAVAEPVGVTPLPPVTEPDGWAGACYSFYENPERPYVQMALDAGSRWDRFDFNWPNIEPSDNNWNLAAYDSLVNDLHAAGMSMIGIPLWTPNWAATSGLRGLAVPSFDQRPPGWYAPGSSPRVTPLAASAASSPPKGLGLPWNDPNNHWGNYVYTIVSRYGDRVKHWEMWNEAEWDYFWTGSEADYAQLLKVGYQATKAACPDCTVLFAGLHYWADPTFFERVLDILNDDPAAPQSNYFFDVMSVHLYSRSSNPYFIVNSIRSRMKAYVPDHPIWLTETGASAYDGSAPGVRTDYSVTEAESAAYLIQSYANALAADVKRYYWFRVHDADMAEHFGLVRNDRSLRPSYVAYQVATTVLVSPTFVTRVPTGSHVRVTLWGTPRGKVSVLWNESPVTGVYTLPAALPTATFVDRWGVTRTVTATDISDSAAEYLVYTATLSAATASRVSDPTDYFVGGDPLIVIESEAPNEPPTATVHPLPALTYSPTFTVTWEGQDNQAGIWLYDVQVRDGDGSWSTWQHSTTATSGQFAGQHGHTYYFRVQATDRVGNRGTWPADSQAHTTLHLASTLHLSIGAFFADENRSDVWDEPISVTKEITLAAVTLRFLDEAGQDVVSPTVGSSWEFTATIYSGQTYRLWASSPGYMRVMSFTWPGGGEVYTVMRPALGLWPMMRTYLPSVLRHG